MKAAGIVPVAEAEEPNVRVGKYNRAFGATGLRVDEDLVSIWRSDQENTVIPQTRDGITDRAGVAGNVIGRIRTIDWVTEEIAGIEAGTERACSGALDVNKIGHTRSPPSRIPAM